MAVSSMDLGGGTHSYGWIPISELDAAVAAGFLTPKEARLVVWSHLPELQRNASLTPPAIAGSEA